MPHCYRSEADLWQSLLHWSWSGAAVCGICAGPGGFPAAHRLFDPARHMRVSEIKPGMKGYGLSVFSGTKIEKFDVEVVDVVKNFNPKYDVDPDSLPAGFLKGHRADRGDERFADLSCMTTPAGRGWPARSRMGGRFPRIVWPACSRSNTCSIARECIRLYAPWDEESGGGRMVIRCRFGRDGHWIRFRLRPWNRSERSRYLPSDRPALGDGHDEHAAAGHAADGRRRERGAMARIAPLFAEIGTGADAGGQRSGIANGQAPPELEPGSVLAVPLLTATWK